MEHKITNIVFTRNRPLQLDGYLRSLYRNLPAELLRTYILHKPELFEEEYRHLFYKYPDCRVVEENDFHSDFLEILDKTETKYILFGIDDVVYFDSVDFGLIDEIFNRFPDDIFGFSLRLSKENTSNGNDYVDEIVVAGQTVHKIDWTKGQTPTTRYPFELCSTIYPTGLVKKILNNQMSNNLLTKRFFSPCSVSMKVLGHSKLRRKILKKFGYFFNPNTLESWNCRWCQNNSQKLSHFLYFQKLCASAIQINMVNTSARNDFCSADEYKVEELNNKYKQGYRIDIDFIRKNKPKKTHAGGEYFKLISKEK